MMPNWVRLCSKPRLLSHADLDMDAKRICYIWHQYFQARPLAETFITIHYLKLTNCLHMRPYKTKPIKTEPSLNEDQDWGGKGDWVFHSVIKKNRKPATPLRFADFIQDKDKNAGSTRDQDSAVSPDTHNLDNISISIAINVLKGDSKKNRSNHEGNRLQQARQITPFSLNNQKEEFQQELSFKGAGNRLSLLTKLDEIQEQVNRIFTAVQDLNRNNNIGFDSFKLLKSNQKDIKLSYYDFYTHLEALAKRVKDFMTELARCKEIMTKIAVGISRKTMEFYVIKFEDLVRELDLSLQHLQNYVNLWLLQQQEKRKPKKYMLAHKCASGHQQQAY